jgi:hypothetical protein
MVDIGREEKKEGEEEIVKDREGVKDRRKTSRERQNVSFWRYFTPFVEFQESTLRCTAAFLSQSFLMHSI